MGVDLEAAKNELIDMKRREEERKLRSGKSLQFPVGETYIRLLPPIDEDYRKAWVEYCQHYGFLSKKNRPVLCPKTYGKDKECPLCEYVHMLHQSGSKEDKNEAFEKRPQWQCQGQALKLDPATMQHDGEVYLFFFKATLKEKFLGWFGHQWYGDFTDENTGRNVKVIRTGTERTDTRYGADICPEKSAIANWEALKPKMVKLTDMLESKRKFLLPIEKLKGIIDGTYQLDEDKDEADTAGEKTAAVGAQDRLAELQRQLEILKNKQQ